MAKRTKKSKVVDVKEVQAANEPLAALSRVA
jgi:hypothetical protein